ncbi:hypothetical protein BC679P4_00006 [Bacteroides phage BC679P4]|nr:hypothetical protein BC679P4_00006 [Bacteroides phage BC679P4]
MAYPIARLRTLFSLAADVKDADLEKAFYEADQLDVRPQLCMTYEATPAEYKPDNDEYTGLDTVICYYAFARYVQTSEQNSTASGVKIQNYLGSYVLPDVSKAKRFEAERGKADQFIEPLLARLQKDGLLEGARDCNRVQSRLCLIR